MRARKIENGSDDGHCWKDVTNSDSLQWNLESITVVVVVPYRYPAAVVLLLFLRREAVDVGGVGQAQVLIGFAAVCGARQRQCIASN